MSKTLKITSSDMQCSGIVITWIKTQQRLDISGWYDSCVGIEGQSYTLREFFDVLGITEIDCKKAWR